MTNGKKIPIILPLLNNESYITNFGDKVNFFNKFFADQCTPIENGSALPNSILPLPDMNLNTINIHSNEIHKIIKSHVVGKAHGYDNVTVRMIKICDFSICRPLEIIFRDCIDLGVFPDQWKRANIVPIHKKNLEIFS